jgi:hypothetical protein
MLAHQQLQGKRVSYLGILFPQIFTNIQAIRLQAQSLVNTRLVIVFYFKNPSILPGAITPFISTTGLQSISVTFQSVIQPFLFVQAEEIPHNNSQNSTCFLQKNFFY